MKFKLKDISIYFRSQCCNALEDKKEDGPTCKSHPRPPRQLIGTDNIHYYFTALAEQEPLFATTITIGNKYVGSMSYHQQYNYFVKLITRKRPYHGDIKYVYHFELTSNGQLHAHGVESGGYAANFHEAFGLLGKHNTSSQAYKPIIDRNFSSYLLYINKENVKPPLHNITKKDIHDITHLRSKGRCANVTNVQNEHLSIRTTPAPPPPLVAFAPSINNI